MAWTISERSGRWTVENTDTGFKYLGSQPEVAINVAIKNGNMPASLRPTLLDDAAAIQQASAPPPTPTEPIPPATENKTSPNDLGGSSGDEEYSYDKAYAAKVDATKNVTNPNNEMETQNESYAGTTTAGQGDKGSANKVKSTEIASGPKPGARPQNPLGSLSSYTYQLTLYMITPDAYDAFIQSGRNNINAINNAANPQVATEVENSMSGAYIIAQSGGINNKTSKRAFDYDYYIDDLKIHTTTNAKAKKTSSNDTEMSFNIYEPYGFSFITKLNNAADILKKKSKLKDYKDLSNATKQFFVLPSITDIYVWNSFHRNDAFDIFARK